MTNEEAKALFEEDLKDGKCSNDCPECNAREMAISAIEKQIPKKPIINNRKIQCINGHNQPIQHYKYCPMCGQLMDWRDFK